MRTANRRSRIVNFRYRIQNSLEGTGKGQDRTSNPLEGANDSPERTPADAGSPVETFSSTVRGFLYAKSLGLSAVATIVSAGKATCGPTNLAGEPEKGR